MGYPCVILGVDPGLANCGWALLANGRMIDRGIVVTARGKKTADAQRRLTDLGRAIHPLVHRANLVIVEWPTGHFGGNALAAAQTIAAAGVVVGIAWGAGRKVRAPAPVTWRSKLGHKRGRDEKLHRDLAARFADHLLGLTKGQLPHVLDALGLALYGELVTNHRPAQLALVH